MAEEREVKLHIVKNCVDYAIQGLEKMRLFPTEED
jgi:uncharacterized protein with ATP-grasp and redox domains